MSNHQNHQNFAKRQKIHWINQPWYHHTVIEKYHMIQPTNRLPESKKNLLKRLWTKWVKKGENIRYPPLMLFNYDKE